MAKRHDGRSDDLSHLLVKNVPYVNSKAEVQYGTLKDLINGRGASSLRTIPRVLEAPC